MEVNIVRKKVTRNTVRVALIYPSLYHVMAASLSTHIIYYMLNEYYREVFVERFHNKKLYGVEEPARSLETRSPLKDYELIITSIHYEPDIVNIVRLLYYSGISPWRRDRKIPIIAGGPPIIANPYPYSEIVDAMVIGEAENTLPEIVDKWLEYRGDKKRFLEELSSLEYVYVPEYDDREPKYREWVKDLDTSYYPIRQYRDLDIEPMFGSGYLLETSRGCLYWCRFCMEGRLFKPYRRRSFDTLKKLVKQGTMINNVERVVIYSLSFPSSRDERKLLEYLVDNGFTASVPSLRIDLVNDDLLQVIRELGQKTITIAPESFHPFIQRIINKYPDTSIFDEVVENIAKHGFNIKLYLIYGFKGEKIKHIRHTIKKIRDLASIARKHNVRLSISVNPLIPKPRTVFQWIGMVKLDYARKVLKIFKRELGGIIDTRLLDISWGWIQASIALANNDIGRILIDWGIEGGGLGSWRRVLNKHRYSTKYVFKGYDFEDDLPWNNIVIDAGAENILQIDYRIVRKVIE